MSDPEKSAKVESVRYCPHCRCKTWHLDGVCEWSDGHKQMKDARPAPDESKDQ